MLFSEDELPEDQEVFLELNAELAQVWPNITGEKESPEDAEEWDGVAGKIKYQRWNLNGLRAAQSAPKCSGLPCPCGKS